MNLANGESAASGSVFLCYIDPMLLRYVIFMVLLFSGLTVLGTEPDCTMGTSVD